MAMSKCFSPVCQACSLGPPCAFPSLKECSFLCLFVLVLLVDGRVLGSCSNRAVDVFRNVHFQNCEKKLRKNMVLESIRDVLEHRLDSKRSN